MTQFVDSRPHPLHAALNDYARRWPDEQEQVTLFQQLLEDNQNPFKRDRLSGHFTASAWVVDLGGTRTLLTHHRKLDRWLQPGGHADGDEDLPGVALKEAEEETGVRDLKLDRRLFDIDRHWIPERGDVPGHWHYDVRYVVRAGADETFVVSEESHDLAWRAISEVASFEDESMRRLARKWTAWVS